MAIAVLPSTSTPALLHPTGPSLENTPGTSPGNSPGDEVVPLALGDWVRAEPFRAHLQHLIASTGLPWRVLARLARAEPHEVQRLLQGSRDGRIVRRVRMPLARRLFALKAESVEEARQNTVGSGPGVEALSRLVDAGWTVTELSGRLRLSAGLLRALLEGRRAVCSQLVEAQILAAAEVLGGVDAPVQARPLPQRQAA